MTAEELKEVYKLFREIQYDTLPQQEKYQDNFRTQVEYDQKYFIEFTSWVKQSYPDVWEAWRAVQAVGRN